MNFPEPIQQRLTELDEITRTYPFEIPLAVAAEFLHISTPSLRAYLQTNNTFGMVWRKDNKANCGYHISTLTFYLWVTNSGISRSISDYMSK